MRSFFTYPGLVCDSVEDSVGPGMLGISVGSGVIGISEGSGVSGASDVSGVGDIVGEAVGLAVGSSVGDIVGQAVGVTVGFGDTGVSVGLVLGLGVLVAGDGVGASVGSRVLDGSGDMVGLWVLVALGIGSSLGFSLAVSSGFLSFSMMVTSVPSPQLSYIHLASSTRSLIQPSEAVDPSLL